MVEALRQKLQNTTANPVDRGNTKAAAKPYKASLTWQARDSRSSCETPN